MYPQQELNRLERVKRVVRSRVARRRLELVAEADRVAQPLRWVDRVHGYWRRVAPVARIAAGPVGILLLRLLTKRRKSVARLVRWGPMIWNFARGFSRGRAHGATV